MKIQTLAEHSAAMEQLSTLMDVNSALDSPESDVLVKLAELIERYEAITFPVAMPKGFA